LYRKDFLKFNRLKFPNRYGEFCIKIGASSIIGVNIMDQAKLDQYSVIMSYLQYENSMYWGRSNFFLLAHSALFGFVITNIPSLGSENSWTDLIALAVGSIIGLILAILWRTALTSAIFWINHWHAILIKLEPKAFDKIKILRGYVNPKSIYEPKRKARNVAFHVVILFKYIWSLLMVYFFVAIIVKLIK
jgi:hypothetical protein